MRWVIIVALIFGWQNGKAQNSDEWIRQKKTQLRYLAEQIAAMKVYAGYLQKGYGIVIGGLAVVSDIKVGEFSLHKDYFTGLQKAKPAIQHNWKIAAMLLSIQRMLLVYRQSGKALPKLQQVNPQYYQAFSKARSGLLTTLVQGISELQLWTTPNVLSIDDAARLSKIDQLYQQMQAHEAFAIQLSSSASGLLENIKLEKASGNTVRLMYGK